MGKDNASKVRFAVVGCGHIGKRHAEMISRDEHCELVALIDVKHQDELGIGKFAVPFFSSPEEFLSSGMDVDVVNIATPNGFHAVQALNVLDGKKHVVIEKPLALTKRDAEDVIFKALSVHKHVFAVMQNRYSPPSVWIKEMVESGRLGRIFMVQLNCYWNRDNRYYRV